MLKIKNNLIKKPRIRENKEIKKQIVIKIIKLDGK